MISIVIRSKKKEVSLSAVFMAGLPAYGGEKGERSQKRF